MYTCVQLAYGYFSSSISSQGLCCVDICCSAGSRPGTSRKMVALRSSWFQSLLQRTHESNISKTVSKNIFLMSQLKRCVSSQTVKISYSSCILPHIHFSSTVWDGCSETRLNKLNSLHHRAAKLLLSYTNSSTYENLKALSILPLQAKQQQPKQQQQKTKNKKPNHQQQQIQLDFNKPVLMLKVNTGCNPPT